MYLAPFAQWGKAIVAGQERETETTTTVIQRKTKSAKQQQQQQLHKVVCRPTATATLAALRVVSCTHLVYSVHTNTHTHTIHTNKQVYKQKKPSATTRNNNKKQLANQQTQQQEAEEE